MSALLQPITTSSGLRLRNRIAMASMTRNRCVHDHKPGPAQAQHYADRARHGPGLIISEGILVDWAGVDYPDAPFLITKEHAEAWKPVVDAVHKEGALMYFQAWHAGRAQSDLMPIMKETKHPIFAPSAVPAAGGRYHYLSGNPGHTTNIVPIETPHTLIQAYIRAATLARDTAGFDGVELLCQGGFLPHNFLSSRSNIRPLIDPYSGSSVVGRCRFILDLVAAMAEVFNGAQHVIVKIAPADVMNDSAVGFVEMLETYSYLIPRLVDLGVGIVCISRRGGTHASADEMSTRPAKFPLLDGYDPVVEFGGLVKREGSGTLFMAGQDYSIEEAEKVVAEGLVDMVQLGRAFITNPDLVTRIRDELPLAENNRGGQVLYGPYKTPDHNYNDWPTANISVMNRENAQTKSAALPPPIKV